MEFNKKYIWYVVVFLIVIIVIAIWYKLNKKYEYDVIIHHSSETVPLPQYIREVDRYKPDIITANQLYPNLYQSETFGKQKLAHSYDNFGSDYNNNYRPQYSSKFSEMWNQWSLTDYLAMNKEKFMPLSGVQYFQLAHACYLHIVPMKRLIDNVTFYSVLLTQTFGGYLNDNSYKAIYAAIKFIKVRFPGKYIISGDFNVHGHEAVFKDLLPDHWVCDFKKVPTCMDNEGLASPDGIVVAKSLYDRVEYSTELCHIESYQHFIVKAKLYRKHPNKGVSIDSKWPLRRMMNQIVKTYTGDNFYNHSGNYSNTTHVEEPNYNLIATEISSTTYTLPAPTEA